ncbi:TIGR01777 family oxidoreductase [Metasolibacillus meyeri]|uniref:TIGR01777 family oxidoreductase n=1 Tax=Metasolibacillus meyeri TaxID=1071052 RepID=UPI000D322521|nr:TIGR01777 family oxidoreductase [Metasolibacillus meyeri]
MKIAIAGGTGLVGRALTALLHEQGHEVITLTREKPKNARHVQWLNGTLPLEQLEGIEAFVNLAGVSLNDGRWTAEQKEAIYHSRMTATEEMLRIVTQLSTPPQVIVNASAVGIYPISTTATYSETSTQRAQDFLGKTVADWEQKASRAKELGIRTCLARFGVILDTEAGALPLIALPYKLFVGGTIGSGKQWLSWIHVRDVARAILHAIETPSLEGAINFAAPQAERMKSFGKTVGRVLNRPHWLSVPSFALQLALGEKSVLVLEGQHVVPDKLMATGFTFQFPTLDEALHDLYKS